MNPKDISAPIADRILDFFNRVREVSDITDTLIEDDPSDGPGSTIGPTLASRILRTRSELTSNRFETLEQLDAISGLGEGTWKDLVYTFGRTAAEAFRDNLYKNGLLFQENWPVWFFEFPIEDNELFEELGFRDTTYREFVSTKLGEITRQEPVVDSLAEAAIQGAKEAPLDRFQDPTLSAVSFAIWFYRLDPGNWFSFDRMYEQTSAYFDYHTPRYSFQERTFNTLLEFVAFKGIPGTILDPAGIVAPDLVTVLNYPDQSITIWMSTLYD
jgi:hypothetical protein